MTTSGSVGAPSRASARDSTDSPTFAAHPPHTMSWAMAGGAENSGVTSPAGPSTWKRSMKRRSIRSFSVNTQPPSAEMPHFDATAVPSPRFSSERKSRWGK